MPCDEREIYPLIESPLFDVDKSVKKAANIVRRIGNQAVHDTVESDSISIKQAITSLENLWHTYFGVLEAVGYKVKITKQFDPDIYQEKFTWETVSDKSQPKQPVFEAKNVTIKQPHRVTAGDIIPVGTNAELLNTMFGKQFKAWMKCLYPLDDNFTVIMLKFGSVNVNWENIKISESCIIEQYTGPLDKKLKNHHGLPQHKKRAIFDKLPNKKGFVFLGIYVMSMDSTEDKRIWDKVDSNFYPKNYQ